MKIALISGSRSDRNGLVMVEKSLKTDGHQVAWMDLHGSLDDKFTYGTPELRAAEATKITGFALWDGSEDKLGADLVILHGDRHEILGAALAANLMQVPITHIGGGDLTEGSQDDCFRHAITKLSHLHFASNRDSADRIVQMGEEPERVHVTGCPGIDMVMATPTLDRDRTFEAVGLFGGSTWPGHGYAPQRSLLVLFHPDTLGGTTLYQLKSLSDALMARTEALVLLGPNSDAGSDPIRAEWQRLVRNRPDTVYHDNVEPQVFYSLLKWCDVLVGNSSAAYYEAPGFGIPAVDIGDRQKGRTIPGNVAAGVWPTKSCIDQAISLARRHEFANPYGDGHASERIAKVIGRIKDPRSLLRKWFRNWPNSMKYDPGIDFWSDYERQA